MCVNFQNLEECANAFEELFVNVIEEQSYGLERVGSKLSGGVDSSGITSILAQNASTILQLIQHILRILIIPIIKKRMNQNILQLY